jgi:hypothetical protein
MFVACSFDRAIAMWGKKDPTVKVFVCGFIVVLVSACAERRQISTFEMMNIRRSAENAERSVEEVNRYTGELKAKNDRLAELITQLKRTADGIEQYSSICESKIENWDKSTLPRSKGIIR